MVGAVGVDLCKVIRIEEALARFGPRFLKRCFTPSERAYCGADAVRLAARFAAKEAVSKALGTGLRGLSWQDIEIENDAAGRPSVRLHGPAADRAAGQGIVRLEISLSHDGDYAIAFVVAVREGSR
ncbi:MAG: holo-ACP synthase [Chloroflexota bacterium]